VACGSGGGIGNRENRGGVRGEEEEEDPRGKGVGGGGETAVRQDVDETAANRAGDASLQNQ